MRCTSRAVSCRIALVLAIGPVAVRAQNPQGAATDGRPACSVLDASEVKRITGRVDYIRRGPMEASADEVPKGVRECDYLGISFSLTSNMTPEWFESTRAGQVKAGTRVEALAGVGDAAYYYWDPRPGANRQVGIAYRLGTRRLVVSDLTTSDSIQVVKPMLLQIVKSTVPRLK